MVLSQTYSPDELTEPFMYFNLENPSTTPWSQIVDGVCKYKGADLRRVSLKEWIAELKTHTIEEAETVPAIKLADFYGNMDNFPSLAVEKALRVAPELDFGPMKVELLEKYLRYQGI